MPTAAEEKYEAHKLAAAERQRKLSQAGREIGPLPPVADPDRRARGMIDPFAFRREYFPTRFKLQFAACHRVAVAGMADCIRDGGKSALAMPRGTGKTAHAEAELMRAILYGWRRFAILLQATEALAAKSLRRIKRELETNDRLLADFPEVCYPIRRLDRIHNRSRGQVLNGKPTGIEWTKNGVTLPTVEGSAASGASIIICSIEGASRGMSIPGPDGEMIRPDLVLIDDVQTRESARSPVLTSYRESIIVDDIMGMEGPDVEIAAVMLCTVIYQNDLSDRFLDSRKYPEWQGVKTRMIEAWPTNLEWWEGEYADTLRESLRSGDKGRQANDLYAANREMADAGGVVSWPERMRKRELSGLQSAMNRYILNPNGFQAEYQNEPMIDAAEAGAKELAPAEVVKRLSGLLRLEIPREAQRLTAFIDVGGELHWYAVVAWDQSFGGAVVDYGAWPRQARSLFAANDPRPGLSAVHAGMPETARVYAGLTALTGEILSRVYQREQGGGDLRIERCLIDAGWNSQTVYQFARQSQYAGIIYPSKGIGRTATARGVAEWKPRPNERSGHHWRLTISETGRGQMVQFDPDAWKSRLYEMLSAPMGSRGCLTFCGKEPRTHEMIGEHVAAETSEPVTLRGATFDKWAVKPHRPDNHLFDCLVGCAVAASVTGLTWSAASAAGMPELERKPKVKVKLSELYRQKNG